MNKVEKEKQLTIASFLFLFGYILVLIAVNISPLSVYFKFAITGGMIALIGIFIKVGTE